MGNFYRKCFRKSFVGLASEDIDVIGTGKGGGG